MPVGLIKARACALMQDQVANLPLLPELVTLSSSVNAALSPDTSIYASGATFSTSLQAMQVQATSCVSATPLGMHERAVYQYSLRH